MNRHVKEEPRKRSVITMKIFGITLLMMGCLMAFSFGLDIIQGYGLTDAWHNAVSPFRVMEVAELFVLIFLLFLFVMDTAFEVIKKKKENK